MSGSKIGFNFQTTNNLNLAQKMSSKEQSVSQDKVLQTDEYIVKRGDTLTEIAVKTGQNLQELLQKNRQIKNPNRIYVGQRIEIGKPSNIYTVKRGDTLSEIAKAKHTTAGDIMRANPKQIGNRNLIYPGQKLLIPIGEQTGVKQSSHSKQPTIEPNVPQMPTKTETPKQQTPVKTSPKVEQPVNSGQANNVNSSYKAINLDDFLDKNKGSNALAAIVIGNAEGNRTPKGGYTESYKGHTDPGDKKHNLGSFSYNPRGSGQVAKTPEEADRIYLGVLASRRAGYEKAVKAAGLDPDNSLLASTYFDAANQSPRAGEKMLAQLDYVKKNGITPETMKEWRFRGYVNHETGQRWAYQGKDGKTQLAGGGFNTVFKSRNGRMPNETELQQTIRSDQSRRLNAIVGALDAQGYKSGNTETKPRISTPIQPANPTENNSSGGAASTKNYRIRPGVSLSDDAKAKLNLIGQEYSKRSGGKVFEVTSGTRTPYSQADAMYTKITLRDNFSEYKNKKAVNEVLDAYKQAKADNKSPQQIKQAMAQTIENQTKQGIYISRHLRGGAIDVSLKGLNEQAFKESVKAVTGQEPLYEGKPRHYHFQF
jgi:LysM repeat protein